MIVGSFFISCLTVEGYRASWSMFLEDMRISYANIFVFYEQFAKERLRKCRIKDPYVPMGSEFNAQSIDIRGITTDFESAEVQGISLALEDATGAPKDLHIETIMVAAVFISVVTIIPR